MPSANAFTEHRHRMVVEQLTGRGVHDVRVVNAMERVAREVHSVEPIAELAQRPRAVLQRLGYTTVHVIEGDCCLGWPAAAPYDAIVVTAEGPSIPPSRRAQLKSGGRLVMLVSESPFEQVLIRVARSADDGDRVEKICPVRFAPLIGAEGWSPAERSPDGWSSTGVPEPQ